jgi:hypothetical protein
VWLISHFKRVSFVLKKHLFNVIAPFILSMLQSLSINIKIIIIEQNETVNKLFNLLKLVEGEGTRWG